MMLLYGATGYTGRLIAERAAAAGLPVVLAGRDGQTLGPLAEALGLSHRVVQLDDPSGLRATLRDFQVVLLAGGPFALTAPAMLAACLETGTHYLDISGELGSLAHTAALDPQARARRLLLLPAVGFDVVVSDGLCAHAQRRAPGVVDLRIGFARLGSPSRGSARSMLIQGSAGLRLRRAGQLVEAVPGSVWHRFDFGDGPHTALAVSFGDLVTGYYATGVPNIATYFEATPALSWSVGLQAALGRAGMSRWLRAAAALEGAGGFPSGLLPARPEPAGRPVVVVEGRDAKGRTVRARITTPDVYRFTATSAVAIATRVLRGDHDSGFQTPSRLYGPDFVLGLDGVVREDF